MELEVFLGVGVEEGLGLGLESVAGCRILGGGWAAGDENGEGQDNG